MIIKYKLGDVAKDLSLANKDVIGALGSYGTDKKHTTVLSESELDFLFDNLTRQHSAADFNAYFVESKPGAKAQPVKSGDAKVDAAFEKRAEEAAAKKEKPVADKSIEIKERVSKVIDTRAASTELDKYNEKYDALAQTTAKGPQQSNSKKKNNNNNFQGKKQKFKRLPRHTAKRSTHLSTD